MTNAERKAHFEKLQAELGNHPAGSSNAPKAHSIDPAAVKSGPGASKRKADQVAESSARPKKGGGVQKKTPQALDVPSSESLWDDDYPFDHHVDSQLTFSRDVATCEGLGIEAMCSQAVTSSIRAGFLGKLIALAFQSLKKSHLEDLTKNEDLKKKLTDQTSIRVGLENELKLLRSEKTQLTSRVRELEEDKATAQASLAAEEAKLDKLKQKISTEYAKGFDRALEQVKAIHGDLDLSATDTWKVVKDGESVDE